ncbi:MAG: pentapeptide repeat-containing protein [Pseudanabaena sp. SU_2_4]|nr:pentapeptide repeat-containing protein [Pseudanabaena sp. SU_2_4]
MFSTSITIKTDELANAAKKLLARYTSGERNFSGENFQGIRLRSADLRGTNLSSVNLSFCQFARL